MLNINRSTRRIAAVAGGHVLLRGLPIAALALAIAAQPAHAQWARYSGSGSTITGQFDGGSGDYAGNVSVSMSNVNDGGGNGVPGIVPLAFTNLTPTFLNNFPSNQDGTFTYFGVTYNHTRDSYKVTVDFSGLQFGALTAGTAFALLDVDIEEDLRNLTAYAPGGAQITSAWLVPMLGPKHKLDYNNSGGDSTGTIVFPSDSFSGGVYQFNGATSNWDSSMLSFRTGANIGSITFDFAKSTFGDADGGGGYGIALGTACVPEPASAAALAMGLAALLARRRKTRR